MVRLISVFGHSDDNYSRGSNRRNEIAMSAREGIVPG